MPEAPIDLQQENEFISDEIREIISYRPHWIVRRGNLIFFLLLAFFLALTAVIEYPDVVPGSARLVALNGPKPVVAKLEGKLVKLFAVNGQEVQKGGHLGYMESTAAYGQVRALQDWIGATIEATKNNEYTTLLTYPLPQFYNLGEMQTAYQSFQGQLEETKQILSSGYYQKKKGALQKDMEYLARLKNNTYKQQQLLEQDQQLQLKEYKAYEILEKEKVIAPLELNQYKSKLIAKEQSLKQVEAQLTNSDIARRNKEKEILELQKTVTDQQQKFHSSLLSLKSEVEKWMQQYVLLAPESGQVLFVQPLQEAETITAGQELFYVQPKQANVYAQLAVAQKGFGKIKTGQKVLLKVESYPVEEFGHLSGFVQSVSAMPNRKDSFLVHVSLPNGLQTSYQRSIFFRNNLSARAEVVTDNRTLFDRFLGRLKEAARQ